MFFIIRVLAQVTALPPLHCFRYWCHCEKAGRPHLEHTLLGDGRVLGKKLHCALTFNCKIPYSYFSFVSQLMLVLQYKQTHLGHCQQSIPSLS